MCDSCLSYGMKYILHHIWNEDRQIQSRICASVVTIATSINAAKCPIAHIYKDGIDIVGFIAPVHVSDVDLVIVEKCQLIARQRCYLRPTNQGLFTAGTHADQ